MPRQPVTNTETKMDGTFLFPCEWHEVFSVFVLKGLLLQVREQVFPVERASGRFSCLVLLPESCWKQGVLWKRGRHVKETGQCHRVFSVSFRCCFLGETILCMLLHAMLFGGSSNTRYLNATINSSVSFRLPDCTHINISINPIYNHATKELREMRALCVTRIITIAFAVQVNTSE